jgi:muramidase (phage lysozyme)
VFGVRDTVLLQADEVSERNLLAFLTMLSVSEGTAGIGQDGYNVLVGSRRDMPLLFGSYSDHPRARIQLNDSLTSTAAGRYQILARYYDAYKKQLSLPDFGPHSQDAIAVQLIRECKALEDIHAGRLVAAVTKCRSRWASLPGAGYGQHENTITALADAYAKAGGTLA